MDNFLNCMIGSVFKILPLNEDNNIGWKDHIDSVHIQLIGAMETYPQLKTNQRYVSIINSINFLRTNEYTKRQCRREVLRCTNTLQLILKGR